MKLQFATLEALSALMIAISAVAIGSQIAGVYQHDYYSYSKNLSMSAAAYDFINQMSENAVARECLSGPAGQWQECASKYDSWYKGAYGINNIGIVNGSGGGNYSRVYCSSHAAGILCVGVS